MKLLSVQPYISTRMGHRRDESLLTFLWEPCWLLKLFGYKPRTIQYLGSGTVWCSYPNIKRCGPFTESCLYDEVGYRVKIELEDMAEPSQQLEEILKERADAADRACQAFYGPIGPVGFKSDTGFAPKDSPPMHELGCCWDTDNGFAPSTT